MNSRFGVAVAALIALVVFGARDTRSQILADILILKSGEKVEGRITNESEMSVTISAETPTGQTERMIPRGEISSLTRNEPLAPAKTPEPESSKPADLSSVSPDKKWEYQPDESAPKIVKADTNEVALDLSDQPAGNGFSFATVIWAPDSKRLAFNYGGPSTWIDGSIPTPQLRTLSLRQVAARRDAPGEMDDGYGTDLLFTLRFDGAGKWKIVKTHRMSEKEVEKIEKGE